MRGIAETQLAAWTDLARDWPAHIDSDGVSRCGRCGKGIMLWVDSSGAVFRYTVDQALALTVLHLRNHHADLDPT